VSHKIRSRRRKFTAEFKKKAVARMDDCDTVVGLARELGISWSLLYKWKKEQLEAATRSREQALEDEVAALKSSLGQKTLELDFFRGALQKIAARRQSGGVTSTTKSGK
jgi:transposase-like protein